MIFNIWIVVISKKKNTTKWCMPLNVWTFCKWSFKFICCLLLQSLISMRLKQRMNKIFIPIPRGIYYFLASLIRICMISTIHYFSKFKFPWEYRLLCFHGNMLLMLKTWLYNVNPLWFNHCLCALKPTTEVVWEQLRRTMQIKAFRLNEYENCGKILKYSILLNYII